jgi:hypothetical protein
VPIPIAEYRTANLELMRLREPQSLEILLLEFASPLTMPPQKSTTACYATANP